MKHCHRQRLNLKYTTKLNNRKLDLSNNLDGNNSMNLIYKNNIEDDRLMYVLVTLGLGNLIFIFNEKKISFIDLLFLSKENLKDMGLEIYQRNRIYNFSTTFNEFARTYSIKEISKFFNINKQFLFNPTIYNKMIKAKKTLNSHSANNSNINIYKNENKYIIDDENNDAEDISRSEYILDGPLSTSRFRNRKKKYLTTDRKSFKANKIFNKYLIIKKGVDEFLNKLDKQKQITEKMTYKLNKINDYIKGINNENYYLNSINNYCNNSNNNSFNNILYNNYNYPNNNSVNNYVYNYNNNYNLSDQNDDDLVSFVYDQNSHKYNDKEININDELNILFDKMNKLEQMSVDENSLDHLNQIKNYINEKGENLMINEIISLQNEIDKITEIILKKEELRRNLEEYNQKIETKKQMLYKLENIDEDDIKTYNL